MDMGLGLSTRREFRLSDDCSRVWEMEEVVDFLGSFDSGTLSSSSESMATAARRRLAVFILDNGGDGERGSLMRDSDVASDGNEEGHDTLFQLTIGGGVGSKLKRSDSLDGRCVDDFLLDLSLLGMLVLRLRDLPDRRFSCGCSGCSVGIALDYFKQAVEQMRVIYPTRNKRSH